MFIKVELSMQRRKEIGSKSTGEARHRRARQAAVTVDVLVDVVLQ